MKIACVGVLSIIAAYKFYISRMLSTPITEQTT